MMLCYMAVEMYDLQEKKEVFVPAKCFFVELNNTETRRLYAELMKLHVSCQISRELFNETFEKSP